MNNFCTTSTAKNGCFYQLTLQNRTRFGAVLFTNNRKYFICDSVLPVKFSDIGTRHLYPVDSSMLDPNFINYIRNLCVLAAECDKLQFEMSNLDSELKKYRTQYNNSYTKARRTISDISQRNAYIKDLNNKASDVKKAYSKRYNELNSARRRASEKYSNLFHQFAHYKCALPTASPYVLHGAYIPVCQTNKQPTSVRPTRKKYRI